MNTQYCRINPGFRKTPLVNRGPGHGLLEREPDPDNRRRTLVWLTRAGLERLRSDADVLDRELVTEAMDALDADTQRGLLDGLEALLAASTHRRTPPKERNAQ